MSKTYIHTADITNTELLLPYIDSVSLPDKASYRRAVDRRDIQTLAGYYLDESSFDFARDGDFVAMGDDFRDAVTDDLLELVGTGTPPYERDELMELYKQVCRAVEVKIEDALDAMEKAVEDGDEL